MSERERTPPVVLLREGVGAGLLLALADLVATGPARTPWRIVLVMLLAGVAGGLLAGCLALALRRRGGAFALVLGAGVALNGLSILSKELGGLGGGGALAVAVIVLLAVAAGLLALDVPRGRRGDQAWAFAALAGVPGASLLAWLLPSSTWTLVLVSALPAAVLGLRAVASRAARTARTTAVAAAVLLLLPVALHDAPPPERSAPNEAHAGAPPGAPDIVLIVVDTLRHDAPDFEGDGALARLAARGVRFEQCVSAAPWTLPAVASLFTSLLPSEHGATNLHRPLPADVTTLAEVLRQNGYETAAFTGGAFVSPAFRLDQGFEHFDETAELGFRPFRVHVPLAWRVAKNRFFPQRWVVRWVGEYAGVRGVIAAAARHLRERDAGRPLFLLVHTYEVHDYYLYHPDPDDWLEGPPPSTRFRGRLSVHPEELRAASQSDLDHFRRVYDRRLELVDWLLDVFLDVLEGGTRERVIALVSDHGEGFDAARGRVHHGGRLHEDLLRVPLVLVAPDLAPGSLVEEPVRTLDLMPTLLDLAGLPVPEGLTGVSLLPALRDEAPFPVEAWAEERSGTSLVALRTRLWKLVRGPGLSQEFDLARDPEETGSSERVVPPELVERVDAFDALYPPRAVPEESVDGAALERLRALGYVDAR